jgi:diguanylate cyclase (GGDEF)-like protein
MEMDPVAAHGHVGGECDANNAGVEPRGLQFAGRDQAARSRDLAALARDASAEIRDREAQARDPADCAAAADREAAVRDREAAAHDREAAAHDREAAARDRDDAARNRTAAAHDRLAAERIRDELLRQLAIAETDQLTGARTRAAGLADIDREIDRARRTSGLLVATYIDVVGLKIVNDAHGHGAGDELLARVVRTIRSQMRSYDVLVRLGGDEFLCAMPGATIADARRRFGAVQAALAADPEPSRIKCGFAELGHRDGAAELIAHADAELPISAPR